MVRPQLGAAPAPEPALPPAAPAPTPLLSDRLAFGLLAGLALAVRGLAFAYTENLYGDAVVRTELAERWLAAPRLITSFADGVYQFGPLHTYVLAAFLWLWHDREQAGKLCSLVFGVLVLWP